MRTLLNTIAVASLAIAAAGPAGAQPYPAKSIRMIIGFPPGGGTDIIGRIVGQRLSEVLQKQKNAITGVKGFDGKYYVVTRAHMERVRRVLARWRGDYVDPKALGAKFGIHPDAVKAVLKILAEGGEYTEKGEVFIKVE